MTATWLRADGDGCVIVVHVQPGAKRTEVAGQHGEALKIRLAAPPVDGKANDSLVAFLAERLDMPKSRVLLLSGQTSRHKRLRLLGATAAAVTAALT